MALVRCPECAAEASERARACPRCGYPVATDARVVSGVMLVVGIAAVLMLVASSLWLPARRFFTPTFSTTAGGTTTTRAIGEWQPDPSDDGLRFASWWGLEREDWDYDRTGNPIVVEDRIRWPLVIAEQAAILALAGAALAWLIRRQRRRRAGLYAR